MTCNVTGTAISPSGQIKPGAKIMLRRAQLDVVSQEGSFVIPDDYIIQTASDGTVDFDILPGVYDATTVAVGGRTVAFRVSVPDEPAADFADLLNASYVEIPPASVTQAQQARDAAIAARNAAQAAEAAAELARDEALLYDGPKVDTFAELASVTPLQLDVGEYIRVISTSVVYQRVSSGGDLDYTGSGGVRLRVVVAGRSQIDAAAFGVVADGVTSDSVALQRAVNAVQGTNCALMLPAGTMRYSAELSITNVIKIVGTGIRSTIFQPAAGYSGWFMGLTETNFINTSNQGPVVNLTNDKAGVVLEGFSVRSQRDLGIGPQHGIRCIGRNDRLKWRDIYIECLEGTHFYFGFPNGATSNPAFIRECDFQNIESRGGGNTATTSDAVVFDSYGSGDANNLCNFFGFRVVYPYRRAISFVNNSTANAIRRLHFFGLLLHGLGSLSPSSTDDLMTITGNVRWCDFYSVMANSTNVGQTAIRTVASGGVAPQGMRFFLNVSSGSGHTFNFESGSAIYASASSLSSTGTDLIVGAGVTGQITFDAMGNTFDSSIDPAAAIYVSCLTSYVDAIPIRSSRIVMGNLASSPVVRAGAGSPASVVSAPSGSIYLNQTGSSERNSDSAYLKRGGSDATGWDAIQVCVGGSTAQRPTSATQYQQYWDSTINKLITFDGTNWRDAMGTIV